MEFLIVRSVLVARRKLFICTTTRIESGFI